MDINLIFLGTIVEALQDIWGAIVYGWDWFWRDAWPIVFHGIEIFVSTVVVKYIILHWVADQLKKWFKNRVIKTRKQLALWFHYRDRAMKRGHADHPQLCFDGLCKEVNDLK